VGAPARRPCAAARDGPTRQRTPYTEQLVQAMTADTGAAGPAEKGSGVGRVHAVLIGVALWLALYAALVVDGALVLVLAIVTEVVVAHRPWCTLSSP
jgi:hypothetical protein